LPGVAWNTDYTEGIKAGADYSILFLGNSFFGVNDLPGQVIGIGADKGKQIYIHLYGIGGGNIEDHWNDGTGLGYIQQGGWTHVVFMPFWWMHGIASSTEQYYLQLFIPYVINVGAVPIIFNPWVWDFPTGAAFGGPTQDSANTTVANMAGAVGITTIVKAGQAWQLSATDGGPTLQSVNGTSYPLATGDGQHPLEPGSYLGACTFFDTLVGIDTTGSTYLPPSNQGFGDTLTSQQRDFLQGIAKAVVGTGPAPGGYLSINVSDTFQNNESPSAEVVTNPPPPPPTPVFSADSADIPSTGGIGTVTLSISDQGASWTVHDVTPGLTVTPMSGTGNATLTFIVPPNTTTATVVYQFSVNPTFTITQEGIPTVTSPGGALLGVCRVGDAGSGVCVCHKHPIPVTGVIIEGSPDTYCNDSNVARNGDLVLGSCGHTGNIVATTVISLVNGLGVARLTDHTIGCVRITLGTCSPNTFAG